jgi:hypothetical protein
MENVVIFNDHLEYFRSFGSIYSCYAIVCDPLVNFSRFGVSENKEKSGNPAADASSDFMDLF